jgi:hypothetical protein
MAASGVSARLDELLAAASERFSLEPLGEEMVGRCPFHPSADTRTLRVSPRWAAFSCSGCGRAGFVEDLLRFTPESEEATG